MFAHFMGHTVGVDFGVALGLFEEKSEFISTATYCVLLVLIQVYHWP